MSESPQGGTSIAPPCPDQPTVFATFAVPDERADAPPWEIKFDRNLQQSRFLRLPDEILLQILLSVATDDLYMLRQVSFTFWRIYRGEIFSKFHRKSGIPVWGRERTNGFENDAKTILRAKRHAFCDPCFKRRTARCYQNHRNYFQLGIKLRCWYCESWHDMILFSREERRQYLAKRPRRCVMQSASIQPCPHINIAVSSIWNRISSPSRRNKHVRRTLGECSECKASARRIALEDSHGYINPPTCRWMLGRFKIEWRLPLFSIPKDDAITYTFLVQKLNEFEERYGDALCVHFKHDHLQLLRALDPRHCCCLGGDSRIGRVFPYDKERWGTRRCMEVAGPNQGEGMLGKHVVRCDKRCTRYKWERKSNQIFLSRLSSTFLRVEEDEKIWENEFATLFDPPSYEPWSDQGTWHLFWCEDVQCRNGQDEIESANAFWC
ncbi:hypothetical protein CKAH01_17556 [Colletotrichum kahawae]|uniref:F-box domain-containing protein n=1 Tax=Colletotrichum kahawae TaxID=34407 RepID=A0AAD9YB91_COLKA|nr:hypothetical protein CKAH01_17556 [Colletotrichum kahawae]